MTIEDQSKASNPQIVPDEGDLSGMTPPSLEQRYHDWQADHRDKGGLTFTATDKLSGQRVTIRLLPGASDLSLAEIERQKRLVRLYGADITLPIAELSSGPLQPRLVLNGVYGERLSESPAALAEKRLPAAARLAAGLTVAIRNGLYHGDISPGTSFVDRSGFIKLDYFRRFAAIDGKNFCEEQTEAAAAVELLRSIVRPVCEDTGFAKEISSRQRAQLRQLLNTPLEQADALQTLESWAAALSAYDEVATARGLPSVSDHPTAEAPEEARESSTQSLVAGVWDDQTREEEVRPPSSDVDLDTTQQFASENRESNGFRVVGQFTPLLPGEQLGRYRLDVLLGRGGMGVVYRATDLVADRIVALKILQFAGSDIEHAVRRFRKEARLLAGVQNDYVTRVYEAGFEDGRHFLAMEYVEGITLRDWLRGGRKADEQAALRVVGDVARALVDAHNNNIIHRDIKPDNILLGRPSGPAKVVQDLDVDVATTAEVTVDLTEPPDESLERFYVKLSDFGIARHIQQSASMDFTRAGSMLGTPLYMSPEQCKGTAEIGPTTDVYSLGITLYALLSGAPPFESDDPMKLAAMHCFDPALDVRKRNPGVSDATADLLHQMLAKSPTDRPADAAAVLRGVERILRGEPDEFEAHPRLPAAAEGTLWSREFTWDLRSSPNELWPYVSNTERLNRAIGLQSVKYKTIRDADGKLHKFGSFRLAGMEIEWEEHPFEWIEGVRMGILREFARGPFRWFCSTVELRALPGGGTRLNHTVKIATRNRLGRWVAAFEAGWKGGHALERVYRRIDSALTHYRDDALFDPFEAKKPPSRAAADRLASRAENMLEHGIAPEVVSRFSEYIAAAAPQALAQIRPLGLSQLIAIPAADSIDACLVAAHCGVLQMRWDILCPTCRAPAGAADVLDQIDSHTRCEACDVAFRSDVADAIELVFQVHPEIRVADAGPYCIGGPEHSPHVVTQIRLAGGERIELPLTLAAGDYLLRGVGLPNTQLIRARATTAPSQIDLTLGREHHGRETPVVRAGRVTLRLSNDLRGDQLFRLERTIDRTGVLTAADVSTNQRFRDLFPDQVFRNGTPVAAEEKTLLSIRVVDPQHFYASYGDSEAFTLLKAVHKLVEEQVASCHGAIIKTSDETVTAAFVDRGDALRAALDIDELAADDQRFNSVPLAFGLHCGRLLIATQNGRLDYFGATVRLVSELSAAVPACVVMTETVFADPHIAGVTAQLTGDIDIQTIDLPSAKQTLVQLITPKRRT